MSNSADEDYAGEDRTVETGAAATDQGLECALTVVGPAQHGGECEEDNRQRDDCATPVAR